MDLIKQNKFISWVIAVLVVLNMVTLAIIWVQSNNGNVPKVVDNAIPPDNSVKLIQKEIGLSGDQTQQYQDMRSDFQTKTKELNDELNSLKLRIADEIFKTNPDKKFVDSAASRIGTLQSKIEVIRFEHFRSLVQICDAGQKDKLQPVLKEVFGKKKPVDNPEPKPLREAVKTFEKNSAAEQDNERIRPDDRQGPPSREEKLEKYAKRLSLSPEQMEQARNIFNTSHAKAAKLRALRDPDPGVIEAEKQKIRHEEDDAIMKILNREQKTEFERMLAKRNR